MKTRNFWVFVFLALILGILLTSCIIISKFLPNDSSNDAKYWRQEAEKLQKEKAQWKTNDDAKHWKQEAEKLQKEKAQWKANSEKSEVSELERKLSVSEKKVKKLSNLLKKATSTDDNLSSEDKEHLDLLYPDMEYDYEIRDSTIKFYSDPSCKEEFLIKKKLVWIGWVDHAYPYFNDPKDSSTYATYFSSKVLDYNNDGGKYDYVYSKTSPLLYAIK